MGQWSLSGATGDRMGRIADTRRVVQDPVSPDLKRVDKAVHALKKALPEMESRLLAAIKASGDHLGLIDFALLQQYEDLQRKHEDSENAH